MTFKQFFIIREAQAQPQQRFYHVCKDTELSSILQQGLLAQQGSPDQQANEPPSVLLFRSLEDAEEAVDKWLRKEFAQNDTLDLLLVTLPQNFPINDDPRMLEVISRADIPPSFIQLIHKNI